MRGLPHPDALAAPLMRGLVYAAALAALATCAAPDAGDDQFDDDPTVLPPTRGQDTIEAWLAAGYYLAPSWTCEAAAHPAIVPSPHGQVRICANPLAEPDPPAEHVVGSSYVLEIYAGSAGSAVGGYGVLSHTNAGLEADSWYWYMRVPAGNATVHDGSGLAADGWGLDGPPATYCAACHQMAGDGSDPGHDFVWVTP